MREDKIFYKFLKIIRGKKKINREVIKDQPILKKYVK